MAGEPAAPWFEWRIAAVLGLIAFALVLAGLLRQEEERDFDTRFERAERDIRALAEDIDRTLEAQETDTPPAPTT